MKTADWGPSPERRRQGGPRVQISEGQVAAVEYDPVPSCCYWKVPGAGAFGSGVYLGAGIALTAGHVAGVSKKWEVGLGGLTIGSVRGHEVAAVRMPSPCHGICGGHDLAIGLLESPPRFRGAIPALATRAVFAAARSTSQGVLIAGFGFGGTRQQVDEDVLNSKRDGIKRFGRGGPVRGDSVAVRPALGFDPRTEFVAGPAHPEDRFSDVCEGDSGGPAFWTDPEGQLWLLGIASRNAGRTGECGSASIFTRIDAWRRWIIETASSFGVDLS